VWRARGVRRRQVHPAPTLLVVRLATDAANARARAKPVTARFMSITSCDVIVGLPIFDF